MKLVRAAIMDLRRINRVLVRLFFVVIAAGGLAALASPAQAACKDPPKQRVNWRGCDLSGADLRGVNLESADLTAANLEGADLSDANLSDAILQGAKLEGAKLQGTRLGRALWPNGRVCARGSVGRCWVGGKGKGNR